MIHPLKRILVYVLTTALLFAGVLQSTQAAMISTEQVVTAAAAQQNRAKIVAALVRPEVQAQLQKMGISAGDAQARVAALTDDETVSVAHQVDALPAGGDGVLGVVVFIFVLLLITDILGLTKVYPFTRSVR